MTNKTNYQSLVNVDDASSFDKVYWLVEERGLDLRLLDAEEDYERLAEWEDVTRAKMEKLEQEGLSARNSVERRYEFEQKVRTWKYIPENIMDKWIEDCYEVQLSHYHYIKMQYKQSRSFLNAIKTKEEILIKLDTPKETEDCSEPKEEKYNKTHWDGAKENGLRRLTRIKYLRKIGHLVDDVLDRYIRSSKEKFERKEICTKEYLEMMALMYRWQGNVKYSKQCIAKLEEKKSAQWSPKSDVPEASAYNFSMEEAIDLKRKAEELAALHMIPVKTALEILVEQEDYQPEEEVCLFGCEEQEDSYDSWNQMMALI